MEGLPVYEPWETRLVPSGHGPEIYYYVFLGTVNSERIGGGERVAITVLMQYDGAINYQMPAHILEEDLPRVLTAINELTASRN